MDYRKGIIWLIVLLVLLLLLSFALFLPGQKKHAETVEFQTIPLIRQNVADIAAIAISNKNASFGLIHNEGELILEPNQADAPLSDEAMQSFIFRLSKLNARAEIKVKKDLAPYGLNPPAAKVTIILKSGGKIRLFLGKQNQFDGTYYIKKESEEAIYLLAEEDAGLLLTDPSDFTDNLVLPKMDLKNLNSLKSIEASFGSEDLPSFKIENQGDFIFGITEPITSTLDYERVLSDLIFPILSLAPVRKAEKSSQVIVPGSEDLRLRIKLDDRFSELAFFRQENGALLLTVQGSSFVFELKDEAVPFLRLHYLDLMNDSIYHCNISEIKSMVVKDLDSGIDYAIHITGDSVELKGNINGLSLGYPRMMELFDVLLQSGIAHKLAEEKKLSQEFPASLSILIHKKKGNVDHLDFSATGNQEEILFINGTAHFTTYYKTVFDIKKALSDLFSK
jgi:hypothetical protein